MKKLLIAGLGAIAFTFTGCGGHDKVTYTTTTTSVPATAGVPSDVIEEFYEMYPSAKDVHWKTKDGLYEAKFEVGGSDMKATFTPGGDFVQANY
jgi:hypothetical protein